MSTEPSVVTSDGRILKGREATEAMQNAYSAKRINGYANRWSVQPTRRDYENARFQGTGTMSAQRARINRAVGGRVV